MPHPGNPAYFKEADPFAWDVKDYAKSQLTNGIAPRRIQDAWHLSLKEIRQCNKGCCSQAEIDQANVHYGRWNHGAKTDRKYLAQWLKAKEAKAEAQKYRGGHPTFNISSVGSIFTAPVDNAYNNAGDVIGGNVSNSASEGQEDSAAATPPTSKDDSDFQQLLSSFRTTYEQMTHKTLLSSGSYLETEIYNVVMKQVTSGFKEVNQVFLWVIDLNDPLIKSWFGDDVLKEIRDRILALPKVHPPVITSISGFVRCTTAAEFRDHAESTDYRLGKPYNKEEHFDASWVHKAILHLVTLIDDSGDLLLSDELLEGTLECVLWATLVDLLLLNVPLVARRRDASLQAFRNRPNKSQGNSPHFDAVISTRTRPRPPPSNGTHDEWGLIEVSRKNDGPDSAKWKKDNFKILRGLCAMMRSARDYVGYDEATVKELQFVGLVLAGLDVMTVRLTCVGNLFVKQEGTVRKVPTTINHLSEAFELLESLWLFKKMMVDCQRAVRNYTDSKERELKRPAPTSPGAYCREKLHKSGAL